MGVGLEGPYGVWGVLWGLWGTIWGLGGPYGVWGGLWDLWSSMGVVGVAVHGHAPTLSGRGFY